MNFPPINLKVDVQKKLLILTILTGTLFFTGCALIAGTVDSVRRAGLTDASRRSLFPAAATKFHEAISWGDIGLAISLASDDYRDELRDQLLRDKDKVKVIDTVIDLSEFEDDAFKALVFVTRRSFTVPFYIANTEKIKQTWHYSMKNGWQIQKQEFMKNNN